TAAGQGGAGAVPFPRLLGHHWQTWRLHQPPFFSFGDFPASPPCPCGKCPCAWCRVGRRLCPGARSDAGAAARSFAPRRSSEQPRGEEEDALPRCQDADNCAGRKLANPIYYYYYYYYYNYFNFFVTFLFL
ncbi:unnamed protein product, partial [Bubo scandiacus]